LAPENARLPEPNGTTTGQTYDVYHPDLVMVGRRALIMGTGGAENPTQFDVTRLVLLYVSELRDLPTSASPPGSNGRA
jgi:hypothetical protein